MKKAARQGSFLVYIISVKRIGIERKQALY